MAACGERANEVVEIFTEFPELIDPHTGRHLMERTTIICNTSNMPVAAREASVYTAMTLCEYYRAMGLKCLLLADSTSRWAQALREMSNRMEELPGADAFPVDLSAIISNFYARAGMVVLNNGQTGAVTFIGTVSPAGGNRPPAASTPSSRTGPTRNATRPSPRWIPIPNTWSIRKSRRTWTRPSNPAGSARSRPQRTSSAAARKPVSRSTSSATTVSR